MAETVKLVLLRHGESEWNKQNKFTGWTDVGLSARGKKEAVKAGKKLSRAGFSFDVVFESFLKRTHQTTDLVLKEMRINPRREKTWRLNERHYGALQGLNKAETAVKYGEAQVKLWRRSYSVRPPALQASDPRNPAKDPLYAGVPKKFLPLTESLADTVKRVLPFWREKVVPLLKKKKKILISASGNSIRAIVKYLDKLSEKEVVELNIPTGIPLVYEFDSRLKPIKKYYLASQKELRKALARVAAQGKARKRG
ncbi:MAG: 2,3-diphosphoglycerate-dependent phosphoglycerate mutase [Candidatus Micrarchaeia archaeon]|jgi:2,3-bisphosphoglycerate-dependent phosphoglycerate mutase